MIDVASLKKQVSYDPTTGALTWLVGRFMGKPAFNCPDAGYLTGKFQQVKIRAHQAAWAIHYGIWPTFSIDHDDGVRSNNRIANLVKATGSINQKNKAPYSKKSKLPTGVSFDQKAKSKPYRARIGDNYQYRLIGSFDTAQAAHQAYLTEAVKLGYSKRHGR